MIYTIAMLETVCEEQINHISRFNQQIQIIHICRAFFSFTFRSLILISICRLNIEIFDNQN